MKLRTFDPTPLDHSGRQQRHFWAITEQRTVEEVVGYSTPNKNAWWVPTMGSTLTIGYHIFEEREQALEHCKIKLQKEILGLQLALLNLK